MGEGKGWCRSDLEIGKLKVDVAVFDNGCAEWFIKANIGAYVP